MSRKIIRVSGPDRETFLQGLVTNDVRHAPCWAALLSPQGKYLADFLIIPDDDNLLIDVDARLAGDLLRRLTMYRLRSNAEITMTDLTVGIGSGHIPEGAIPDPRHYGLGWRKYGSSGSDGTNWDALRVAHCIPETLVELIPNETYILEVGFERLHGVDFRKGCYVGQEVTARMKHKTELRRGLVPVRIDGAAPVGTPVMRDGREIGTLFTQSGTRAIALMRLDKMGTGMSAGNARIYAAA
ncbi:MAG: folate-binding protein [Paracoccus sp. (in: a-proteobacteria)]|uniref:CAF17-like 4Fe-4S cluster assembly/insertion protein YgfZ n=1 Tax=Paracoccus sp. TaxID=267 RepID=UPI0026E042CE|nr:folate-binding protein [Paracoccus sp. (in: a-proteobacteria)]MDO5631742.1 folate-binding protein [Paracoccus sp. (in: a-proteobacteria)]